MIRLALESDMPAMLRMAQAFCEAAGVEFSAASCEQTLRLLLQQSPNVLFVADVDGVVGMAGALSFPMYFNHAKKCAQEVFWWMDKEHRGGREGLRLLQALEIWAERTGHDEFTMVALAKLTPEKLHQLYRSRGYEPREQHYTKGLH